MRLQARSPVGEEAPFLRPQHHAHIHRRPDGKAVYHLCEHHPGYTVLRQADDVLDKLGEGGSARCSSRTIEQDNGASNADFRRRRKAGCISLYKNGLSSFAGELVRYCLSDKTTALPGIPLV